MTAAPPATDPAPPPAFDLADPGVLLRLRRLFDTDLLGIFFFGYDGAITAANDAFLRSVGYDRGDLAAGRVDWAAMTPPEYAAQDAAKAAEVKARGRCVPFEKVYLHRDGRPVPVLIGAVEADADGGVCFVLDLTERKRLERERRESDRLHRFALDAAGLGTWDFDVVTEEVVWDARCRAMFGLGDDGGVTGGDGGEPRSAGPTTLSDPLNFIHPDDLAAVRGRIAAAVAPASDGKYETQYRTVGPDGRLRWVRAVGRAACEGEGAERRAARLRGVLEDVTARRAADEAARRREAEVRALFQCAAFGMVELDARGGRVVRANDAFCAILGRPFEELEGRPVADFTHPDDRGTVRETFAALAAGRSATLDFEQRYERPDGSAVWAAVSASAVRQDGGPVRRVFAVVRNVTVRIRAAAAAAMLAEAGTALAAGPDLETALAAAAGAAVPAFADWCAVDLAPRPDPDAEGRPAGGEQEGGAAAGLRRVAVAHADPGRRRLAERLHADFPPDPEEPFGVPAVFRTGEPELAPEIDDALLVAAARTEAHLAALRELGLKSYICVPLRPDGGGPVSGVLTLAAAEGGRRFDETDLEAASELARRMGQAIENARLLAALAASEARFRGTFENAAVGVAHVGLDGRWLRVNRRLCEIVGLTGEELLAKTFQDITHPDDLQNDLDLFARLLDGQIERYTIRKRYFRGDGETVWIRLTVGLQRAADGAVRYAISVIDDIAERVRIEGSLRDAYERLEGWNATLELKVAARTAEVRAQKARLERLARGLADAEARERRRLAHAVHDDLQQVLAAAKMSAARAGGDAGGDAAGAAAQAVELLDEAIAEARSLTQDLVPTVLYDRGLVPAVAALCRRTAERFHADVEFLHAGRDPAGDAPPGGPGDPPASDLVPRGYIWGPLMFQAARELVFNAVKHAPGAPVRVSLGRAEPPGFRMTVHNPPATRAPNPHIGAVRSDGYAGGPADPADAGEGFGLFSLREQAALAGGALLTDRTAGGGFTATLTLPAGETAETPEAEPAAGAGPATLRVMIVDDHRIVRSALAGLLRGAEGIEVVGEAADGQEAVDRVEEYGPDAVVMDVTMPRMDGIEATRRVKELLPGVRVVGLSMHTRDDMAEAMCAAGAEAYVPKGGPPEELLNALRGNPDPADCCHGPVAS